MVMLLGHCTLIEYENKESLDSTNPYLGSKTLVKFEVKEPLFLTQMAANQISLDPHIHFPLEVLRFNFDEDILRFKEMTSVGVYGAMKEAYQKITLETRA